ncbi:hypothetical protein E3N88_19152 [Mikania micrantha]|uniref:CCHC-type domain-containing protein n=1 Tax=Mikania micrantha TaxID=192012 RepID=A0A5N6NMD0_9ASTR|nr:hypothetical protein E3N88_19152 [Mikania micrantha]
MFCCYLAVNALKEIAKQLGKEDWDFSLNPCDGNPNWNTPTNQNLPRLQNVVNCSCLDDACHVVNISLMGQDLGGVLPSSLAKLPSIKMINLAFNYLNGTIPNDWASTKLEFIEYIVNKLVTDMRKLSIFRDTLKNLMEQTDVDTRDRPLVKQKDIVSSFVPNNEELTSDVRVPSGIRNKGSGSHKRFKSKREQAISRMGKRSRGCHACGQAGHDRRTCPALRGPQKT